MPWFRDYVKFRLVQIVHNLCFLHSFGERFYFLVLCIKRHSCIFVLKCFLFVAQVMVKPVNLLTDTYFVSGRARHWHQKMNKTNPPPLLNTWLYMAKTELVVLLIQCVKYKQMLKINLEIPRQATWLYSVSSYVNKYWENLICFT